MTEIELDLFIKEELTKLRKKKQVKNILSPEATQSLDRDLLERDLEKVLQLQQTVLKYFRLFQNNIPSEEIEKLTEGNLNLQELVDCLEDLRSYVDEGI